MKNKKILGLTVAVMMSTVSIMNVGATFAATLTTTNQQGVPQKPENEICGKITAIDANTVTIAVATRKEMEKPANGTINGGTPPEKPANDGTQKFDGTNPPAKPNMDNMFTLTGETKTINISSATFGGGHMGKPNDNANANATNATNATQTQKTKTYADYAVGDYVSIEMTDATSLVAKTVRDAGFGGGPRGEKGERPQKQSQ